MNVEQIQISLQATKEYSMKKLFITFLIIGAFSASAFEMCTFGPSGRTHNFRRLDCTNQETFRAINGHSNDNPIYNMRQYFIAVKALVSEKLGYEMIDGSTFVKK